MSVKSSVEKMAEPIGYDIGMSDDETQAALLNGFCKAISNSMQDHAQETQICYIVDKLSSGSCEIIKKMYSFIELKNN